MNLLILMASIAAEDCYTENELYTGTTTRQECEPWSEAAWSWPQMSEKYSGSKNYCRLVKKRCEPEIEFISGKKFQVNSRGATHTIAHSLQAQTTMNAQSR